MSRDAFGNPLSDQDEAVVRGLNDFIEGFLAYETRAARIVTLAESRPKSLMANLYAGLIWMLLEAPEGAARAGAFLERARAVEAPLARERLQLQILAAWIADDVAAALDLSEAAVRAHPRDLVMVKLHQYLAFNLGRFDKMLHIADLAREAAAESPFLHGMRAFALEELNRLPEAEEAAHRALSLKAKEPWAQHALAHVMIAEGRIEDGARFLESAKDGWTDLNSFMLTHLFWHLALFYISQGREAEALRLYDDRIWGVEKAYSQDQVGAVSLLARLEFAGLDVGARWDDLAAWLAVRAADVVQPFLSLHYLYGLARAGRREAVQLGEAIASRARLARGVVRPAWADVALPAARAILDFHRGESAHAARELGRVLPRLVEIGGSHAQRDLFEQIRLKAVILSGDAASARRLLEARRSQDPLAAPLNEALGDAFEALGLTDEAQAARSRARLTRAAHGGAAA
jgi:predicted Zn-dependent protease